MTRRKNAVEASACDGQQADARLVYEQAIRKLRLSHRWRAADGRSALGELNRAAYGDTTGLGRRKLSIEDASVLAGRLDGFLQEVAPRLKELHVSRGELCRRAGLCGRPIKDAADRLPEDAKELHRLTLPPGTDPRRRGIRVGPEKYLELIKVLAEVLSENLEVVADRLLSDTSLHPKAVGERSDMEKAQSRLQRIVNEIDLDFDLMKSFRRTAELKSKWIGEGSQVSWPLWDFSDLYEDGGSAEDLEAYRAERVVAADPNQAFYRRSKYFGRRRTEGEWWLFGFETGALQDDEFFYVPHAPLGHVLMWDLPDRRTDRVAYELAVKRQVRDIRRNPADLALPHDDWDAAAACPTGQTGALTRNWRLQGFFWLLAYPHPDGNRLVPTLYQAGEEGGAYMVPLDMEALETLSDAVWVSPTEHCSVVDRLAALLVDVGEDGLNPIERNMRRTATWLVDNPILKLQREREDRSRRLDEVFRAESRQVTRHQAKKAVTRNPYKAKDGTHE